MNQTDINSLNQQFGLDQQLQFVAGAGGLTMVEISNSLSCATLALQGAHLMTWTPRRHHPVVWLSPEAKFAVGKSIRGGVPICWPWFGPHVSDSKLPGHGFARTVPWEVEATRALSNGSTQIQLKLVESDASRAQWPHNTPVQMRITVGATLTCELITHNATTAPVTLGDAFHTYFAVSDIRQVKVHGLGNNPYIDKVDGGKRKQQTGPIQFTSETDRIYLESRADCMIEDPLWRRRIRVHKRGSASTIVWTPWSEKAEKMGDFGPNGYLGVVCVESANAAEDVVNIPAGGQHRLWVEYAVEKL